MYDYLVESNNANDDCSSNKSEQITRKNVIELGEFSITTTTIKSAIKLK